MLDKQDIKTIKGLLNDALKEFYETLLMPYFEQNEHDHKEIKEHLKKHDRDITTIQNEVHDIQGKLDKNQTEHNEILDKLDTFQKQTTQQNKRITKLETATGL